MVGHLVDAENKLESLYQNAPKNQWSHESDIDWTLPIARPSWLKRRFYASLISQFKYGELATIQICEKLKKSILEPHLIELLDRQIADETRHAAAYEKYLNLLGDQAPQDPAMAHLQEALLEWKGTHLGLIVAVHILLEGEALRTLQDIADDFPCPLFADMNIRITRDEARHVAFGNLYLKSRLQSLEPEERLEIFQFIKCLWKETTSEILTGFYVPGFVTYRLRNRWVEQGWQRHCKTMANIGLIQFNHSIRM